MDGMYVQQPHDPQRFLSAIRQNLISQATYAKACRQLMQWCSSLTMYQPQYETSLLACLSVSFYLVYWLEIYMCTCLWELAFI